MARIYGDLSWTHFRLGEYAKAIESAQQGLRIAEGTGYEEDAADCYDALGMIYAQKGDYDKTIEHQERALRARKGMGDRLGLARSLINLGIAYKYKGEYDKALEYYQRSLAVMTKLREREEMPAILDRIGTIYVKLKDFTKAADYFRRSIMILEQLRLTASGTIRRGFFSSQISSYLGLISTYIKDDKPHLAFNTIELSLLDGLQEPDIDLGGPSHLVQRNASLFPRPFQFLRQRYLLILFRHSRLFPPQRLRAPASRMCIP